jgi:hypothetical protein
MKGQQQHVFERREAHQSRAHQRPVGEVEGRARFIGSQALELPLPLRTAARFDADSGQHRIVGRPD